MLKNDNYEKKGSLHDDISLIEEKKQLDFAKRLKERREYLSISQEKLAIDTGVSKTTVQNYEGGQYPRGEHAISLSKVLECSLDWLLLGKEKKGKDSTTIELTHLEVDERLVCLEKKVADLEKENSLLMKVIEAQEESLRDKEENLKAKDESLGLYRQILVQAQKTLSTVKKRAIQPIGALAFSPSAPLADQNNK